MQLVILELPAKLNRPVSIFPSNVQDGWPGRGNINIDPLFAAGSGGTWTSNGIYDKDKCQLTFTDDTACWNDNELANKLVEPDITYMLQFVIISNTSNTITIWADKSTIDAQTSWVSEGATYHIYDYHLQSEAGRWDVNSQSWVQDDVTSPCIDAGNPCSLLGDEQSDPNNVRINMGAYGGTGEASKTPAKWSLLADLTNDGIVAFEDFAGQALDWLRTTSGQPGDLNRDGTIGMVDIEILTGDWLEQTIWYEP